MRGKLSNGKFCSHKQGITPAHAGKTRPSHHRRRAREDHPRACGENWDKARHGVRRVGSPPRMRGKPITEAFKADIDRITPAHAGKTG